MSNNARFRHLWALLAGAAMAAFSATGQAQAPEFVFDPGWPRPLPNNWKTGGITGLAVDADDNVWVYNRPNDLTALELRAEPAPPIALCCARPPAMIHFDRRGNVIGSFDAPQGHGMDVDDEGFVYLGQDTVRKYDPGTGEVVAEIGDGVPLVEIDLRPGREPERKKALVDAIAEILNDTMGVDAADIYVVFRENPAENHYCGGTPLPPWVPADA